MKIIVIGIGGVGGYFGGLLARHFEQNPNINISFLARGEHLKQIQKNGLKIIKGNETFIAKPHLATDNPAELGIADIVIICTKTYDLEQSLEQVKICIHPHTIILPLLNGVDSQRRIQNIFPNNLILDGCVYIVSRLKEAGVVENSGNIQKLFFGLDNFLNDRLLFLEKIFQEAGIEAVLSKNISSIIWEKFVFISPTASATSYFDNCIGALLLDDKKVAKIRALIEEIKELAAAMKIELPANISEKTLDKLKALPFETTSSMHSDFQQNISTLRQAQPIASSMKKTELESLTGYVVREGEKYGLEMLVYREVYGVLKGR